MELQVLGACLKSRQTNDLVTEHLNDKDFSKEYQIIRGLIKEYYDRDREASRVDPQLLNGIIENSVQNKKHRERFMDMVEQAANIDVSSANMDELILKGKLTAIGMRLATALVNGDNSVDELYEEYGQIKGMESLDDLTGKGVEVLTIDDMQSVVEAASDGSSLLKVYPLSLNAKLNGGLGGGHHLVTFARPEQGKTAFNLTIACGFASQGATGIYFLNEDRLEDVYLRGLCCITGQPENVIKSDLSKWGEIARDMGFGNIMFVSLAPGTLADIDRFCEKYKPRWIVVDQLRNLQMKETNKVLQLEYATTGIRNIAKKHNLIAVSTTQAGDSAEGKRLLDMGDVDFSNCLAKGTEVLMYDGSKRAIEHINVGEQVMGMDGTPRNVLATGNGRQPLYKITHKNGDNYTVNQQHIMVVKNADNRTNAGIPSKSVGDIPLQTLLDRPALLTKLKGIWFAGREFDHADLPIDPYLFGLWLADGFSHTLSISTSDLQLRDYLCTKFAHLTPAVRAVNVDNSIVAFSKQANGHPNPLNNVLRKLGVLRNKHIPEIYLRASEAQRLALLAGVIDGDGSMRRTKPSASDCYTIYSGNNDKLAEDTVELCKSLGFYTCKTRSHPTCWAIRISGKITSIPCVLDRKKATLDSQIDYLASNMRIEKVADDGEFFGITVDKDERYVLGNYIVTHNTGVAAQADVLVGVGATREDAEQGVRYLAISKNKRGGGHAQIPVKINTSISRYMPYT